MTEQSLRSKARLPDTAICLKCGYSLRGLPEDVCPECGRAFNSADPLTWQDTSAPGAWQQTLLRCALPAGRLEIAAVVTTTLLLLIFGSTRTHRGISREFLPLEGFLLLAPAFVLRYSARRHAPAHLLPVQSTLQRLFMPVCLGVLLAGATVLAVLPQPNERTLRSRYPELVPLAEVMRAGSPPHGPCTIGRNRFRRIALLADRRVKFEFVEGGSAIVYDPDRITPYGTWSMMRWDR